MILKCIAIDDEPLALELLEDYISKTPFLKLEHLFNNAISAMDYLRETHVDIIFVDIQMPDLNGIDFIKLLENPPHLIITTAYDQYAVQSYELEVNDYLLKPIAYERFYKAVSRILEKKISISVPKTNSEIINHKKDYIFIKSEYKVIKVLLEEILYCEGLKDYIQIHTHGGKFLTLMSFKKLSEILPENKFVRVHKSYLVSIAKIDTIERNRIIINEQYIPIGEAYKEKFNEVIGI